MTKKATATIDLRKAVAVHDHNLADMKGRGRDTDDMLFGVDRAFRIEFKGGEEIAFFADTDAEKAKW